MKQDRIERKGGKAPAAQALGKNSAQGKVKPPKADGKCSPATVPVVSLKKDKLIRDSFTLPREDFELIEVLKDRALDFKRPTKKSELIRAGLQALAGLGQKELQVALDALRPLKVGRPKNKT